MTETCCKYLKICSECVHSYTCGYSQIKIECLFNGHWSIAQARCKFYEPQILQWDDKVSKSKNWTEGRDKAYHLIPVSTDEDYRIACYFYDKLTEQFKPWGIKFDMPTFELKQYTRVRQGGWDIYYQFSEDSDGPYMEVYAMHRMTSDSRKYYYLNDKTKILPSFNTVCVVGEEDIFNTYNDEVSKIVFNKTNGILRGMREYEL